MEATAADGCAFMAQVLSLLDQVERVLDEPPGALRMLRLHCLREKARALLDALDPGLQLRDDRARQLIHFCRLS